MSEGAMSRIAGAIRRSRVGVVPFGGSEAIRLSVAGAIAVTVAGAMTLSTVGAMTVSLVGVMALSVAGAMTLAHVDGRR